MPTRHGPFLSKNTDILVPSNSESVESGMLIFRFERMIAQVMLYYKEQRFTHIPGSTYSLSGDGDGALNRDLPKLYGVYTTEYVHYLAKKRLFDEGKISGGIGFERIHLPPKFAKLSYQQVADTLLWYAQYSDREERELIMEFLVTDGRCGGGWNEYNEKNKRVQAILSQVANSYLVQQFPKE